LWWITITGMEPNPQHGITGADRDLGKLKGLIFLIVPLTIALWPIRNISIVLVLHGFTGYSQGIRLVSQKPAKLSTGELVPQILDAASGFLTMTVAACIVYYSVAALNRWLIRIGLLSSPKVADHRWGWSIFWPSLIGLLICGSLIFVGPASLQHVFLFMAAAGALFAVASASQIWHEHRA
jgi:hypothetical protein